VQSERLAVREVLVIDPAMERSAPLLLDDWFTAIGNSHTGQYCFTSGCLFFYNGYQTDEYNQSALLFDGTFFNYENPTRDNLTVEKGLALNDMAVRIFHAHIEPLMERNDRQESIKLRPQSYI